MPIHLIFKNTSVLGKLNKNICECCDNDSSILIDFAEDTKPTSLGTRVYLCEDCKRYLIDKLLPF